MSIFVIISFLVFAVVFSFVFFMLAFYYWRWPSHRKLCRKLPSPKMLPIIGVGLELVKLKYSDLIDYAGNLIKQCGSICYAECLGLPIVILTDPQDIELIFTNSQHISKGVEYQTLTPWLGEGLLTSTGEKWHARRKLLTPAFHFEILQNFMPVFNRNAKILAEKLACAKNSAIDINSYVSLCTLDIICETAMGTRMGFQLGEEPKYVSDLKKAKDIIATIIMTFWMHNECIFWMSPFGRKYLRIIDRLHSFTEKVIKDRKETYQASYAYQKETEIGKHTQRRSFLDCLLEMQRNNPSEMTNIDIREEVDTFLFEGQDTVSMAITWALFMIACHEDVQAKLHKEIEQVFQSNSERDATLKDLHQLRYLDMVIKETLRLYPSVPYLSRTIESDMKIKGYTIPGNTNVSIIAYWLHRNADIYPDPEKFIPERFLPEKVKERHPFAYIPFSAGYRNCIGQKFARQEVKVVILTILRKLKLSTEMKKDQVKVLPIVIIRPDVKIKITFTSYC